MFVLVKYEMQSESDNINAGCRQQYSSENKIRRSRFMTNYILVKFDHFAHMKLKSPCLLK